MKKIYSNFLFLLLILSIVPSTSTVDTSIMYLQYQSTGLEVSYKIEISQNGKPYPGKLNEIYTFPFELPVVDSSVVTIETIGSTDVKTINEAGKIIISDLEAVKESLAFTIDNEIYNNSTSNLNFYYPITIVNGSISNNVFELAIASDFTILGGNIELSNSRFNISYIGADFYYEYMFNENGILESFYFEDTTIFDSNIVVHIRQKQDFPNFRMSSYTIEDLVIDEREMTTGADWDYKVYNSGITSVVNVRALSRLDELSFNSTLFSYIAWSTTDSIDASKLETDLGKYFEIKIDGEIVDANKNAGLIFQIFLPTVIVFENGTRKPLVDVYTSDMNDKLGIKTDQELIVSHELGDDLKIKLVAKKDLFNLDSDKIIKSMEKSFSRKGLLRSAIVEYTDGTGYDLKYKHSVSRFNVGYGDATTNRYEEFSVKPIRIELAKIADDPTNNSIIEINAIGKINEIIFNSTLFSYIAFGTTDSIDSGKLGIDLNKYFKIIIDGENDDANKNAGLIMQAYLPSTIIFENGTRKLLTDVYTSDMKEQLGIHGNQELLVSHGDGDKIKIKFITKSSRFELSLDKTLQLMNKTYTKSGYLTYGVVEFTDGTGYILTNSTKEESKPIKISYSDDVEYYSRFIISSSKLITIIGRNFGKTAEIEISGKGLSKIELPGELFGEIIFFDVRQNIELFSNYQFNDYFTVKINGTPVEADLDIMLILQVFLPNVVIMDDGKKVEMISYIADEKNQKSLGFGDDTFETMIVTAIIEVSYSNAGMQLDQIDTKIRSMKASYDKNGVLLEKEVVVEDDTLFKWILLEKIIGTEQESDVPTLPISFLPIFIAIFSVGIISKKKKVIFN